MKYEKQYEVYCCYGGEKKGICRVVHSLSDAVQLTFGAEHFGIAILGSGYLSEFYDLQKREVYFTEYIGNGKHKAKTIKF
jgi:hypothetical protein